MPFPPVPAPVKGIAHYLKVADEHESRNIVVTYWCRMYACQAAMKMLPGKKPPDVSSLLVAIMDWLEKTKTSQHDVEGIVEEVTAQALIEQYAIQLFTYADEQDNLQNYNKNVVKAFYTAGILMDVLSQFGQLSEDIAEKRKYAKWKAAYIHNCLKSGDIPAPGPPKDLENNDHLIHKSLVEGFDDNEKSTPSPSDADLPGENAPGSSNVQPFVLPSTPAPTTPSIPTTPTIATPTVLPSTPSGASGGSVSLTADQMEKAQKYCKWAASALTYDDVKTAVDNLHKALRLLEFGQDS